VDVVLSTFAILVTCVRLFDRIKKHLLWWDDTYAVMSVVFAVVFMAGNIMEQCTLSSCETRNFRALSFYLSVVCFYSAIWAARLSILFTVVRICPNWIVRNALLTLGGLFFLAWGILVGQVLFICEKHSGWKDGDTNGKCVLGEDVVIAQIITVVIADILLIFLPLRFIWRVSIERGRQIRLTCVFAATIVMTCLNIYHAVTVLQSSTERNEQRSVIVEAIAAIIEVSVTLIICNLSVLFAVLFRIAKDETANNRKNIPMRDLSINRTPHMRHKASTSMSSCPSAAAVTDPFAIAEVVSPEMEREMDHKASLGRRNSHPLRVMIRGDSVSAPRSTISHTDSWAATNYSQDEECPKWDASDGIGIEDSPKTVEGEVAFRLPMLGKR